eukprot:TRINITY_DN3748_c0_g1_i4.p1 TRINITY_DN3748_c0_g1~~TRINITY_DN3748_c0_g1_i4.p1  ORF type:complete len:223 (-),score=-27.67 TRINITY_DN3748_c0_g1_i4:565-1158(-)
MSKTCESPFSFNSQPISIISKYIPTNSQHYQLGETCLKQTLNALPQSNQHKISCQTKYTRCITTILLHDHNQQHVVYNLTKRLVFQRNVMVHTCIARFICQYKHPNSHIDFSSLQQRNKYQCYKLLNGIKVRRNKLSPQCVHKCSNGTFLKLSTLYTILKSCDMSIFMLNYNETILTERTFIATHNNCFIMNQHQLI